MEKTTKNVLILIMLFSITAIYSQVGVNTKKPDATLDVIYKTNPSKKIFRTQESEIGKENFVITESGKVGVNLQDAVPDANLHAKGTVKLEVDGASEGRVLTSDALGNATWKDVGSPKEINNSAFGSVRGNLKIVKPDTFTNADDMENSIVNENYYVYVFNKKSLQTISLGDPSGKNMGRIIIIRNDGDEVLQFRPTTNDPNTNTQPKLAIPIAGFAMIISTGQKWIVVMTDGSASN